MKARWVFYFDQGNVVTDFEDDIEDMRLQDILENTKEGFIAFPSGKLSIYANLNLVKCITREMVEDAPQALPDAPKVDEIPLVVPEIVD